MGGKRLDVQGLRAVAVGVVILNHLIGRPSGGFVGVDVFFVISGFLITGLLLREQERSSRISFTGFYKRRVKRILPAALLVTIATIAMAWALFPVSRWASILADAGWSSLFAANWRFIATGTDYQHATDDLSPLQHFWSLSVEEQFYILWPLLMVVTIALATRHSRAWIAVVLAVVTASSFGWAMWESTVNPTWSYFSTTSRAWELGLGALLAVASPQLARIPAGLRPWLSWTGLLLLAAGAIAITSTTTWPAPWGLWPVAATMLVIAAGTGAAPRYLLPLTNPVMTYLGTISYSLYLWHLPVIVFVGTLLPARGEKYMVFSLSLILLLSVLTYHWIEDPLRRKEWSWSLFRRSTSISRGRRVALPVVLVALAVLGIVTFNSRLGYAVEAADISALEINRSASAVQEARDGIIDAALGATAWPKLAPRVDDLGPTSKAAEWVEDGCLGLESGNTLTPEDNALRCVYGDPEATKTVDVIGDSTAISYVPAIRSALTEGWRIEVYTMAQCPAISLDVFLADGSKSPLCRPFREFAYEHARAERPEVVVLTGTPTALGVLESGATGSAALREWRVATQDTFTKLAGLNVVSLDGPPPMPALIVCDVAGSTPASCESTPSAEFVDAGVATRDVAAEFPNVKVPSTIGWFCNVDGKCPGYIGDAPTLVDGVHLTQASSKKLGPLMREALGIE